MVYKFDQIAYNITTKRTPTKDDMLTYIGLEHLESGCLNVSSYGSKVEIKGDKLVMTKGDVLLGKRNAYLRRAAIAPHDGLFSAHGMILRPKEEVIDKSFFPFFIASDIFFDEAVRISVGGLSPTINWKDLKEVEFTLPSLSEQKVLADKLWAAYRVKESYKKLLAATDDMLKAKFQEMFGEEEKTISYGDLFYDDTRHASKIVAAEYKQEGKYAIYDQSSDKVICGYTDMADGVCLDYPTILFGDHSRVIKYIDTPFFIGADGVKIIRPLGSDFDIKFAYYMLKYYNIPNTGYNRHYKYLQAAKFLCPPLPLQQQFVEIATQAEATKESLRKSIENIDQVIKSLINQ